MVSRSLTTIIGLTGVVALTGCGTLGGEPHDDSGQESPESTSEESPEQASEDSPDEPREPAEDVTLTMDDAVQTITYPIQGSFAEGEVTMGLHSLEVVDDAMLLTVSFVPEYEDPSEVHLFQNLHSLGSTTLLPVVNDRENLKAYHVPRQTTNQFAQGGGWLGGSFATGAWASPVGDIEAQHGELITHWAYFPAPEDDIDTVDVAVVPGVQEFQDVEIQR